jgi:Tetracyclin repressor-like, C-terminal domain
MQVRYVEYSPVVSSLRSGQCAVTRPERVGVNRSYGPHQAGPGASGGAIPAAGDVCIAPRDVVIRAAVLQVLAEEGYRGGLSRALDGRCWQGRRCRQSHHLSSLVQQGGPAGERRPGDERRQPRHPGHRDGTLRNDLVQVLRPLADVLTGPVGDANRALLGVLPEQPALAEAYRCGPRSQRAGAFSAVFERAAQRGDLPKCGPIVGRRGRPGDPYGAVAPRRSPHE